MFPIIQALLTAQQMKKNKGSGGNDGKAQTALGLGSLLSGWQQPPADKSVVNFAEDPTGKSIFDQYQKQKPLTY